MAVVRYAGDRWSGLSTDTKPTNAMLGGLFLETDTGEVYFYNGTSWSQIAGSGGASELSDLSDVNTSTATNRNVLVADGTDWESRALVEADISDLGSYALDTHTHPASDIVSGTFANARISETSVTQHEAALTITESQISDLGSYLVSADLNGYTQASVNEDITGQWNFNADVGIGTTNPSHNLEVEADENPTFALHTRQKEAAAAPEYSFGEIDWISDDGLGGAADVPVARIAARANTGSTVPGGELVFYTNLLGGSQLSEPAERMRITHDGDVGIGTTDPEERLHVLSSNDTPLRVESSGFSSGIQLANFLSPNGSISYNDSTLEFVTENSERMSVDATSLNMLVDIDLNNNHLICDQRIVEHQGDSDTYLHFPSADEFELVAGNNPKIKVDSVGDISFFGNIIKGHKASVIDVGSGTGTTVVDLNDTGTTFYATTSLGNTRSFRVDSADVGTQVEVHFNGFGTCRFTEGAGQTIIQGSTVQGSTVDIKNGGAVVAKCLAANTWSVVGDTA